MKSKFRCLVEIALRKEAYTKMKNWVENYTAKFYTLLNELQEKESAPLYITSINNIPIIIGIIDFEKSFAGYDPFAKALVIYVKNLTELIDEKANTKIEHEFIHAYHDLILHLPIKKEYDYQKISTGDINEFKKYVNSEEEFNAHSEEILYFILKQTEKENLDNRFNYAMNIVNKLFSAATNEIKLSYATFIAGLTLEHKQELYNYLKAEINERYGEQ